MSERITMLPVKPSLAAMAAGGVFALSSVLLAAPAYGAAPKDCAAAVAVQTKVSADAARLDSARDGAKRKADTANDVLATAKTKQARDAATLSAAQAQLAQDEAAVNSAQAAFTAQPTAANLTALQAATNKYNADKQKVADAKATLDSDNTAVATAQADADAANKAYQEARREADAADAALAEANASVNKLCGGNNGTGNNTPRLTCVDYAAKGVFDIRRGTDNRYRGYLDPDHDGIACEFKGEGNPPPAVIPGPQGHSGPQGPQGPAGPSGSAGGNSSSTVIVVPPAPTGEGFSQIGQAPAGAAQTGFGPGA